jgi:hypothetical protein
MATTPEQRAPGLDVRERLERAVVARLMSLRVEKNGPCCVIKEYAGDFERLHDTNEVTVDDLKAAIGGRIPALLISAGPSRYDSISVNHGRALAALDVEILVASATLRTKEARERGEDSIFAIMRDVRDLLHSVELDVDGAGPLRIMTEEPMLHAPALCIWKMTFQAAFLHRPDETPKGTPITSIVARGHKAEIYGTGDAFEVAAGVVTLTDAYGGWTRDLLGWSIEIAGATTPANNGVFSIADVPDAGAGTQVRFVNAAGVTEAFGGNWTIRRAAPLVTSAPQL